jgi:nitric oxide reductase subunit B
MHNEIMQTLRWLRVPGDTIFAFGAIALVLFIAGLKTGHSIHKDKRTELPERLPEEQATPS